MRINTNVAAMNTYSRLTAANTAKSNSLAKLSSGSRINKAGRRRFGNLRKDEGSNRWPYTGKAQCPGRHFPCPDS